MPDTGDSSGIWEGSVDTIIPPESSSGSGINSNQRNVGVTNSLYQQNIVNRQYDKIGGNAKFIDFDVDKNNIYVLESKSNTTTGDTVRVYGIDDSIAKREISLKGMTGCTAIAIMDGSLYAYDSPTGSVFVFSAGGDYEKKYESELKGLRVWKMEAGGQGRILFGTSGNSDEGNSIKVLDLIRHETFSINKSGLTHKIVTAVKKGTEGGQISEPAAYIQDFCLMDNHSILIKIFPERLCLYDINSRTPEKISYMPDSARFIEYDSGILYYAAGLKIGIYSNSIANLSGEGSQDIVGRLLVNGKFPWSLDSLSLLDFQLGDLIIPYTDKSSSHEQMRQNNKYIFLLDGGSLPETAGDGGNGAGNTIYRVAK